MGRKRKTDKHLPERMYLKSGGYYLVTIENKWIFLGRSYPMAMAKYGELTDFSAKKCRTVSDLIDRYISEISTTQAENSHKNNMQGAKQLKAGLGHNHIGAITAQTVYRYLDCRMDKRYAAKRELVLLKQCYRYAIEWGYASRNPCDDVKRNFQLKAHNRKVTDEEYNAFRDSAEDLIAAYMDFKYLTGLRCVDILAIELTNIKDDGIHVYIHKTKEWVKFIWTDHLRLAVENIGKLRRRVGSSHLFVTRKGTPYTRDGFSSIWQRKMKKAVKEGVLKESFREHDIRAKTASDSNSLEDAAALLGHKDKRTTEHHYWHNVREVKPLR